MSNLSVSLNSSLPFFNEDRTHWNPYYFAFCQAHGILPGHTLPGKTNIQTNGEFMRWIQRKWAIWRGLNGLMGVYLTDDQKAQFGAWLARGAR